MEAKNYDLAVKAIKEAKVCDECKAFATEVVNGIFGKVKVEVPKFQTGDIVKCVGKTDGAGDAFGEMGIVLGIENEKHNPFFNSWRIEFFRKLEQAHSINGHSKSGKGFWINGEHLELVHRPSINFEGGLK